MPDIEYTSIEKKKIAFGKFFSEIDAIQEFHMLYDSLKEKDHAIFRGVNEAKYKIFSSLQRKFQIEAINRIKYQDQFSFMNQEIQELEGSKVLPKYYKSLGTPITDYLYMSFLQHYSAPTTFIDFSENIDKALYFATRDIEYSYPTDNKTISNYVSLYWIESTNGKLPLPPVYDIVVKQCIKALYAFLSTLETSAVQTDRDDNHSEKSEDIKTVKQVINKYLSFDYLKSVELGLILGNNDSRYQRLFVEEQYYVDLCGQITKYLKTRSKSAMNLWQESIKFLFKEAVVIANLNQVAQEGCFIHFLPPDVNTALEEYEVPESNSKLEIHCANIHKSLCPYIQKWLYDQKNISQQSLFPNPQTIAENAYNMSLTALKER